MPEGMPDRMPEDMPDKMPEDMPDRMPEGLPNKVPECLPHRMPEDLPDRMSEDMPEDMPESMPEHTPEDMPGRMPEDMPDRIPEDMPDRMPEYLPVTKRINVMVGITRSNLIYILNPVLAPSILIFTVRFQGVLAFLIDCVHNILPREAGYIYKPAYHVQRVAIINKFLIIIFIASKHQVVTLD